LCEFVDIDITQLVNENRAYSEVHDCHVRTFNKNFQVSLISEGFGLSMNQLGHDRLHGTFYATVERLVTLLKHLKVLKNSDV